MKEIGGYIELDTYRMPMLHEEALALNCGRNCLLYIIKARKIKKILLPQFLCDSVKNLCQKEKIEVKYYSIDEAFKPQDITLQEDEWLYLVNFYGQLTNTYIDEIHKQFRRVIVDNAQAYYQMPVKDVDTLYTCRKFFGVADGAFLYTKAMLDEELQQDESFERMHFLLGRYERTASEFYQEYSMNNKLFADEPVKYMSRLTYNLLHAIDYQEVRERRTENYKYLFEYFKGINKLKLKEIEGAFMYPLWIENGAEIRKALQREKIYIPLLWPNVLQEVDENSKEYSMAKNIIPIPVDQRYSIEDLERVCKLIKM